MYFRNIHPIITVALYGFYYMASIQAAFSHALLGFRTLVVVRDKKKKFISNTLDHMVVVAGPPFDVGH